MNPLSAVGGTTGPLSPGVSALPEEETRTAGSAASAPEASHLQEAPSPGRTLLYDPARADRIAGRLRELLDPAYILLFGSFAGGTPHSETLAYDLLVVTDGKPPYDWYGAKRYLKMHLRCIGHGAPYLNPYVHARNEAEGLYTPFFWLARTEGTLLYSRDGQKVFRPRRSPDFGRAASDAKRYASSFLSLGTEQLGEAEAALARTDTRRAALAAGQAAVYAYRTLFYVYHGFEADTCNLHRLHQRLRTLSGELPLLFDPDDFNANHTLSCLKGALERATYEPDFTVAPPEMRAHLDRVKRLHDVVGKRCRRRIGLYEERAR